MSSQSQSQTQPLSKPTKTYYKLCMGTLPDELYFDHVPVERWLVHAEQSPSSSSSASTSCGFPPNSLNRLVPLERSVEMERIFGIALYMVGNVLPFLVPPLLVASILLETTIVRYMLMGILGYVGSLIVIVERYYKPYFLKRYQRSNILTTNIKDNQYLYTERNTSKYLNTTIVWPDTLHPGTGGMTTVEGMTTTNSSSSSFRRDRPVIFCLIPHGVAPLGATAYPIWSKIWSSKLCHWTCAPIVLRLPIIGYYLQRIGYIPAKSSYILDCLQKKEESVGIFLDGIAGMFHQGGGTGKPHGDAAAVECAYLKQRKGIVKIALRAGTPIIPVYAFGHTAAYTVLVDPLGILEWFSTRLEASLTPFLGRWGWFLGPPRRVPVTLCLGEPIPIPTGEKRIVDPTKEDIDNYHAQMVAGFQQVFDQHKEAYGWKDTKLKIV